MGQEFYGSEKMQAVYYLITALAFVLPEDLIEWWENVIGAEVERIEVKRIFVQYCVLFYSIVYYVLNAM